jgi:hypothetical protein
MHIGQDRVQDEKRFFITKRGVVLVTPDMLRKAGASQLATTQPGAAQPGAGAGPPGGPGQRTPTTA